MLFAALCALFFSRAVGWVQFFSLTKSTLHYNAASRVRWLGSIFMCLAILTSHSLFFITSTDSVSSCSPGLGAFCSAYFRRLSWDDHLVDALPPSEQGRVDLPSALAVVCFNLNQAAYMNFVLVAH